MKFFNYLSKTNVKFFFVGKKFNKKYIKIYAPVNLTKKELSLYLFDIFNIKLINNHSYIVKQKNKNKKIFWIEYF